MHADHVTGTGKLKQISGCKSVISKASGAQADVHVDESDVITFGKLDLRILATPGHTNGCVTYHLPEQVSYLHNRLRGVLICAESARQIDVFIIEFVAPHAPTPAKEELNLKQIVMEIFAGNLRGPR